MNTSAPDPLIRLEGVTCAYQHAAVLTGIDLVIHDRQFTGVVGPSGSGKTSLLRALLGQLAPLTGTVERRAGLRIGYVPQVELVDWNFPVTVGECVLMARTRGRTVPWSSAAERRDVREILTRLGIGDLADRHIRELSGGQQQRVFIARALLSHPQLLLMDEPTSGVDLRTRHDILHLLRQLHDDGLAIVLTTHDLNGIAAHLPDLVCLNVEVIGHGPPARVLTPEVLELTYDARMEVLEHAGFPVVVDSHNHHRPDRPVLPAAGA